MFTGDGGQILQFPVYRLSLSSLQQSRSTVRVCDRCNYTSPLQGEKPKVRPRVKLCIGDQLLCRQFWQYWGL